jgi:type IV pilus assembly protein PilM
MGFFRAHRSDGNQPSLGIDIGSQVVKAVQLNQSAGRIDIQAADAFRFPAGHLVNGVVEDPRKFGKLLSSFLESSGIQDALTVMSVPSNMAILRWVSLPHLEGGELRDAARFKVKRHLPFPVESAYVEASPPAVEDEEGTGQSLVIAVRRDVIDSRADALDAAGLDVVAAELEAQAILRIVERKLGEQSALWRDASLTIIDIGANNTHMYVVQNQRLQFIRGVKFGSRVIASALASEFALSLEAADDLLSQPDSYLTTDGVLHLKAGDLPAMINVQTEMEKLTREFLRLMRYFRSLHPERSYAGILDHVLICGGLASLRGIGEYLQQVLGLRVEQSRPFAGMVGKFNKETFELIANRQEAYTAVTGLALSGLRSRTHQQGESSVRREFAWARSA